MARAKLPSKPADRTPPPDYPEFAVRHDAFDRHFEKPLPPSTFHDLVSDGIIIPVKALRGFYKLNESLCRLGLRPVRTLPKELPGRSLEDITRLAFTGIDPLLFPAPSWLLAVEAIDARDLDHAGHVADLHRDAVAALGSVEERLAYFGGAIDAAVMAENEPVNETSGD